MSTIRAGHECGSRVKVRRMIARDLTAILRLVRELVQPWRGWEFLATVRTAEMIGCVAEARDTIVGFALCAPVRHVEAHPTSRFRAIGGFLQRLIGSKPLAPICVSLLEVMALGDKSTTEQALLERLDRDLHRLGSPVRVIVPETKLTAQLFFRGARYRAVRVLHEYFGTEDGYLMEGQQGASGAEGLAGGKAGQETPVTAQAV
jgi:hypothetical protein